MIREQISKLIQDAHDGNESAAKAFAMLKEIETVVKAGLEVLKEPTRIEALEFNKGEVYFGGTWEIRNTATYLDFSKDDVFVSLNKSALARKKDLNQAWKAKQEGKFYATDEGEEIPVLPVKTPSSQTVIFKQK